jgi:hypothetical protein
MRPWLVFLGVAFLLVGVAGFASLLLLPQPTVSQSATSQLDGHVTPQATTVSVAVPAANASHGVLSLRWSSSNPVGVRLTTACPPAAPSCRPSVLASWSANLSGSYSFQGALQWEYVLSWSTPQGPPTTFGFSTSASWSVSVPPSIANALAEVASGLLAAVGAVALFLGLFLRSGFRRPPPLTSHGADDASGIAMATGPRTETSDAGSSRLPPGPPSHSA